MKFKLLAVAVFSMIHLCGLSPLINRILFMLEVPTEDENQEIQAERTVIEFYRLLNQGYYVEAAVIYGGSYDVLQGYNPDLDPEDKAGLLEAGCRFNGLMCLEVLSIELDQSNAQGSDIYHVVFANPDGSPFMLGPCCGETEETMPPISVFPVQVKCEPAGVCRVFDLPPYVP